MDVQFVMLLMWLGVPLVAFAGAGVLIPWRERRSPAAQPFDPVQRLEQLRKRRELGQHISGGRMSEALRLAENSAATATLQLRHH